MTAHDGPEYASAQFAFEFPWTARDGELKDHNALLFSFIQNVHLFIEIDRDRLWSHRTHYLAKCFSDSAGRADNN